MFGAIFDLIDKVKSLDVNKIAVFCYYDKDIQRLILRANRIEQLAEGLNTEGEIIGYYKSGSVFESDSKTYTFENISVQKIEGEPYNFIDSGAFMRSFEMVVYPDGFSIIADTDKGEDDLAIKYKNLLGLTDDNKEQLAQAMVPLFIEQIRKTLLS